MRGAWVKHRPTIIGILAALALVSSVIPGQLLYQVRGPGGMDLSCFLAVGTVLMIVGMAVGYWSRGSWLILLCVLMVVSGDNRLYFSRRLFGELAGAPVAALGWWVVDLMGGIGLGYYARCRDRARTAPADAA